MTLRPDSPHPNLPRNPHPSLPRLRGRVGWGRGRVGWGHLALFFFIAAAASFAPPAGAAQVAASIEFDAAPRPAGLPEDMQPLPGASLKFLAIKAIDGSKIDTALWQPDNIS